MSMISDIYLGNNIPIERSTFDIPGYTELHQKWLSLYDDLKKMLSDEQTAALEELLDTGGNLNDMFSTSCYESGFRDGAKLMIEILKGGDADAEIRDLENTIHTEH